MENYSLTNIFFLRLAWRQKYLETIFIKKKIPRNKQDSYFSGASYCVNEESEQPKRSRGGAN